MTMFLALVEPRYLALVLSAVLGLLVELFRLRRWG